MTLAARLCSLAGPGEVLASETVTALARTVGGLVYADKGSTQLKGFLETTRVYRVEPESRPHEQTAATPARFSDAELTARQSLPIGGYLGSLPAGPLVAREDLLSPLLVALEDVQAGAGRLALLAGEPGAGKTRLAQELTVHARNRGFLLAAGRCYEPEQTVAYYPFLDVFSTLFAVAPRSIQKEAVYRWPYLGVLLPEQVGVPEGGAGQDEEQRVFRAATSFVQTVAQTSPLALLLDDLQWADSSSLKLFLHLARHTRTAPVLLVATYRDREVGWQHPLEGALRDLHREGLAHRILVTRLSQDSTRQLVGAALGEKEISEEFAQLIHTRTDGNPYFVQQVVRDLIERREVFRKDGSWDRRTITAIEVPESIRSVIGQRLSRLEADTQEVLREASVLGQVFSFDDLLAMAERVEEELERLLEGARVAGLIQTEDGEDYRFDHALTQQALYCDVAPRKRRRLHRAAGEAIERLPERRRKGRAAELAWHFLQTDEVEKALRYSMESGVQAQNVFAYAEAERHFRTIAEMARELEEQPREAEALEQLGHILVVASRLHEAAEALERSATLYHNLHDLDAEAGVIAEIADLAYLQGNLASIIDRVRSMRAAIEGQGASVALARLYGAEANYLFGVEGRFDECRELCRQRLGMARQVGDEQFLMAVLITSAIPERAAGHVAEALEMLREGSRRAAAIGDLHWQCNASLILADTYYLRGPLPSALDAYGQACELAKRLHDPGRIAYLLSSCGEVLRLQGDWIGALQELERAQEWVRLAEDSIASFFALARAGHLYTLLGRWEEAEQYLGQAWDLAVHSDDKQVQRISLAYLAGLERLRGNLEEARAWLERDREQTSWEVIAGWVLLDTGCASEAEEVAHRGLTTVGVPHFDIAGWHAVLGAVMTRQERWDDGAQHFEAGLTVARDMGMPLMEAQLLQYQGRMHAARGDCDAARVNRETALAIYQKLGARPFIEQVEQELPSPS